MGESKWKEILSDKVDIDLKVIDILALAYSVMEYLKPLIEDQTKLFFEQANGCLSSYYFCKRSLEKIANKYGNKVIEEYKIHKKLFAFFKHHIDNSGDRLRWELNPIRPDTIETNNGKIDLY